MSKNVMVTAQKGNKTKQFTLLNWENMPKDKYGWELTSAPSKVETPKEVSEAPPETTKVSITKLCILCIFLILLGENRVTEQYQFTNIGFNILILEPLCFL